LAVTVAGWQRKNATVPVGVGPAPLTVAESVTEAPGATSVAFVLACVAVVEFSLPPGGDATGFNGAPIIAQSTELPDPAAGDHVIVTGLLRVQGLGTGRRADVPFVHDWTLEDGRAVAWRCHTDTAVLQAVRSSR
jgi:hypothetical protein